MIINLHVNECSPKFHYYPFAVELHRCIGDCNCNCNSLVSICSKKTEDLNLIGLQ